MFFKQKMCVHALMSWNIIYDVIPKTVTQILY